MANLQQTFKIDPDTADTDCLENKDESQLVKENCTDPVEGEDGGNDSHENKPEPKPKVDFLINDILKNTSIMTVNGCM